MSYIAYTIFSDVACNKVNRAVECSGELANRVLDAFKSNNNGIAAQERDIICGCRIDRIGSEQYPI